jgi:SAM-dependent methyltransferase
MDMAKFDKRNYPVISPARGYGEWAASYEETVAVGLDRPLLARIATIDWKSLRRAADLAAGTGRTGEWLREAGVGAIDALDLTPEMLARARAKNIYASLKVGDAAASGFDAAAYDLAAFVLADEHVADLAPLYREAARILAPGGAFLLIGYHPFFLMNGLPTHFHRASGEAVTIESHVHLASDHFAAGVAAGLVLAEFRECVIDEAWLETKPKWRAYLNWPVSFALVWRR